MLQQTFQALKQTAKDSDHMFTHIVDIGDSFEDTVTSLASVYAKVNTIRCIGLTYRSITVFRHHRAMVSNNWTKETDQCSRILSILGIV